MATNAKKQVKPFNVDYMRKKSIYILSNRTENNLLIVETYLLQSKDGIFEHLIDLHPCDQVPDDVDRVACITGSGVWFSPVDSLLEVGFMNDGLEINYVGHKVPFLPAGTLVVLQNVQFKKKVYAMEVQSRTSKSLPRSLKSDIDSVFKSLGFSAERPKDDDKKKKNNIEKDKEKEKKDGKEKKEKHDKNKEKEKRNNNHNNEKGNSSSGQDQSRPTIGAKPVIPKKVSSEAEGEVIGGKFIFNESWLMTKNDVLPSFQKDLDYVIQYENDAFEMFMKASPGVLKGDPSVSVSTSKNERVFIFDSDKRMMIGFVDCISDNPMSVARISPFTFALVRIGGI